MHGAYSCTPFCGDKHWVFVKLMKCKGKNIKLNDFHKSVKFCANYFCAFCTKVCKICHHMKNAQNAQTVPLCNTAYTMRNMQTEQNALTLKKFTPADKVIQHN
jgi:hypothetical protein